MQIFLSREANQDVDVGNLCNNAYVGEDGKFIGQPTDIALLDVVLRSGLSDEREVSVLSGMEIGDLLYRD